jgi:hypothetical protein
VLVEGAHGDYLAVARRMFVEWAKLGGAQTHAVLALPAIQID